MGKFLALCVFMVFSTLSSDAHRRKLTGTNSYDSTLVIDQKIGDVDYHKYGKLIIEKKGSKFYLTFPVLLYMTGADFYNHTNDSIAIGSPIFLTLNNGEVVTSKTDRNTDFALHYLWPVFFHPGFDSYAWHDDKNGPEVTYRDYAYYYATTWLLKFEFTTADMLALSKNRILNAHARKGGQIIFIPVKKKQSKEIKKSISALLRN